MVKRKKELTADGNEKTNRDLLKGSNKAPKPTPNPS